MAEIDTEALGILLFIVVILLIVGSGKGGED